jgi:hypothetical protein
MIILLLNPILEGLLENIHFPTSLAIRYPFLCPASNRNPDCAGFGRRWFEIGLHIKVEPKFSPHLGKAVLPQTQKAILVA